MWVISDTLQMRSFIYQWQTFLLKALCAFSGIIQCYCYSICLCNGIMEDVLFLIVAVPKELNEDRLCYEESLHREEWPWIGKYLHILHIA